MNYIDLLNDERVIEIYKTIDEDNPYPISHGMKHINTVVSNVEKLVKMFELEEVDKENLLIASVLHDVGRLTDRDNHAVAGEALIRELLGDSLDNNRIDEIVRIIANHGVNEENDSKDFLSKLLIFADKMDFSKKRLIDDYTKRYSNKIYEKIDDVVIDKIDEGIIVGVFISNKDDVEAIEDHKIYIKVNKAIDILSKHLGKDVRIEYKY
ncbi:MAG: HD domain-containing protein [Clostridia bacterium]|jgi:HD superfamily phosphohydrolase YqeK|nr:HD domain-containing protein [Clostridia bacterium]